MPQTMLDYIREIPEYIRDSMKDPKAEWRTLAESYRKRVYSSITIIASGSSFHAVGCASYCLRRELRVPVYMETPFTFSHYGLVDPESFYIVISQSGRSINSLEAARLLREKGVTVHFLTDHPDMSSEAGQQIYHLKIGNEKIPFVTKGFSATVFFLLAFAKDSCRERDRQGTSWLDTDLFSRQFDLQMKAAQDFFEGNRKYLLEMSRSHICGGGPGRYVAAEAALKFCETLQMSASGYEVEEFLHGGNFELKRDHTVFLIDSAPAVHGRAHQLQENLPCLCGHTYLLEKAEQPDEDAAAILYSCFFQTLVYELNRAKGNEIPLMRKEYLEFEESMKAKTINYYQ